MRFSIAGLLLLTQAAPQDPKEPAPLTITVPLRDRTKIDDPGFLKRLTRDLWDAAPTEADLKAFAADPDPDKRKKKIGQLLADDRFADFWARRFGEAFFGDVAKANMDRIAGLAPAAAARIERDFVAWLRDQLGRDRPWSEIVSETITARGKTESNPAVGYKLSFFRGNGFPVELAAGLSRHFLGIHLACARCHDHPFDQWTVVHFYGLAAFAAREKAEAYGTEGHVELGTVGSGEVLIDPIAIDSEIVKKSRSSGEAKPIFLFGGEAGPGDEDRLKVLAPLVTGRGNTQLRKALANRAWSWLMGGQGIVNPVDDFHFRNKALIGALEPMTSYLISNNDSVKALVRGICGSDAYQAVEGPPAPEGMVSYWRGILHRTEAPRIRPKKNAESFGLKVEAPAAWVRGRIQTYTPGQDQSPQAVVPGKRNPSQLALFAVLGSGPWVARNDLERWTPMMPGAKSRTEALEGKHKATLLDLSGPMTCVPGSDGPVAWRVLGATLDTPDGPWYLRLSGPAEAVEDWREDFVTLLKGATK
jgi:hypothetical protein